MTIETERACPYVSNEMKHYDKATAGKKLTSKSFMKLAGILQQVVV